MEARISSPTTDAAAQHETSDSFAWRLCGDCDDEKRIEIKEDALEFGLSKCEHLINKFEQFLSDARLNDESTSNLLGRESLRKWIEDCRDLTKLHKKFEVLVGVAGSTGSGKTSALNALLGFNELLPTNNQEASTAVVCKVSYNDSDKSSMKFRACVTFRTKANLVRQLDTFFEDLKGRDELRAADGDSLEDQEALRNTNARLKPTFEMIRTIFGIEECDVAGMTTQTLLEQNESVTKLLGTTKKFHAGHEDQLAEQIKPYTDSTTAQHTTSGLKFAAWPLIDEVELYIKSDILKNGVVLVDLPGIADAVESRADVARNYFPKLAATLIISPARRAADESAAVKLMSDHQELQIQMNGKFHKNSFCVVVSQTDHIDRRSAVKNREDKSNSKLKDLLEEESKLKEATKQLQQLRVAEKTAAPKKIPRYFSHSRIKRQRRDRDNLKDDIDKLEKELEHLDGHITFLCVQSRNKFLEGRIQRDFQRRQTELTHSGQNKPRDIYDGRVSVYPTKDKPLTGFPDQRYSGIPSLHQWIRKATIDERESHANSILYDLLNHYNVIQIWAREEWGHDRLQINREWLENDVFPIFYADLRKDLNAYWTELNKSAGRYNPLRDRTQSLNNCAGQCRKVVKGWSFKNDTTAAKIHWLTYQVNISRHGGSFESISGTYHWMEDISVVLLRTIVADWDQALNHDIPGLYEPASKFVDNIWEHFSINLEPSVRNIAPNLLPFLHEIIPDLVMIKEQIKDRVRQALMSISRGASEVHPNMVKIIQKKWVSTFNEALKIKGKGSFKARQDLLARFAEKSGIKMFNAAFEDMKNKPKENFNRFPGDLQDISEFAIRLVQNRIQVLLNNIAIPDAKIEEAFKEKVELQQYVRSTLMDWDLKWKLHGTFHKVRMIEEEVLIPDEYLVEETKMTKTVMRWILMMKIRTLAGFSILTTYFE
ncbi:uncharacterized protein F4812DRAFT_470723 [Daldinia caldariorum]|uniref:uncharacterized protein n=1 Tax=Daldinia caldariorum TaxID=326644 RepID=UPI002007EF84|nr:uncharacterized protein F4812DRAFT_470723 [Daldinia caldariorum]KAI1468989.1 hypothetical protein F4812DRAFT_470723 [Daldinia caldariorum]